MTASAALSPNTEATASLVRLNDGWHIRLSFDGNMQEIYSIVAFDTPEEADAALEDWCKVRGITQMTAH